MHVVASKKLGRRDALGFGLGFIALSCGRGRAGGGAPQSPPPLPLGANPNAVELWAWIDFPNDPRKSELSGIVWDAHAGLLYAVSDDPPRIVTIAPDATFRDFRLGEALDVDAKGPLDLEGIAALPDGFLLASEIGPRVIEVDRQGHYRRDIALPPELSEALPNKSLESLALSPSQRTVFFATEVGLPRDGGPATQARGSHIRIVALDRGTGAFEEHAYLTDPSPHAVGDYGVADLAAVSDDDLLVLERGWSKIDGNTVRIYRVRLSEGSPLRKTLLIDLGTLDARGFPLSKQPQPSKILDNFEGLALGPHLADGRRLLFVVSDDNGHETQVARLLVLALRTIG